MSDQSNFLFKYRYIDTNNIERTKRLFTHNELFFANVNQFNDPFDCKFDYSFEASVADKKRYFRENLKRIVGDAKPRSRNGLGTR